MEIDIKQQQRIYIVGAKPENKEVFAFEGELVFSATNIGLIKITEGDKLFDNAQEAFAYRSELLKQQQVAVEAESAAAEDTTAAAKKPNTVKKKKR
ncbi:MAG: hypothetical protein PHR53_00905 [Bacteroidales bacterium]|nr:hypothetical protein [Bacteroidales bacterium]